MKFLSLILSLVSTLALSANAQERRVQFRTICLQHQKEITEVLVPGRSDTIQKVPLYTSDLSPVIEATFPGGEAVFYIEKTGPDGKPLRVPVAKTKLAQAARQLFVFVPGADPEKAAYEVRAYDDDDKSFPMGSVRVINFSPVSVRFIMAGVTGPEIPAGKATQFPQATKVNEYNMYSVSVEFLSAGGKWVQGASQSWKAGKDKRELVFTLVDLKYKQPDVRLFTDIPPWTEAPATPPQ